MCRTRVRQNWLCCWPPRPTCIGQRQAVVLPVPGQPGSGAALATGVVGGGDLPASAAQLWAALGGATTQGRPGASRTSHPGAEPAGAAEALQLIPAILLSGFNDRPIEEIFGQGQAEGEARGKAEGEALGETTVILRLLNRRCGPLDAATAPTARRRRGEPELQGC